MDRINDPADLEIVTPIECKAHPGYYHIPGHKNYVISREGAVIRLSDGFGPKIYTEKTGYKTVRLQIGNHKTQVRTHRLLGMVFIGRPTRHMDKDFSELEINHIDSNKTNNSLDNLEWCNDYENTLHAHLNGKTDFNRKPIVARDIRTNTETVYTGLAVCEKAFEIKPGHLGTHLASKYAGTRTKKWHVFKRQETEGWPSLPKDGFVENSWDLVKVWYAHNPLTNKTFITGNHLELVEITGATYSQVIGHINTKEFTIPLNGWFIEPRMEHVTSETTIDIHSRVRLNGHYIKRTDLSTGDVRIFKNLKDAAAETNTSVNRISRNIFLKQNVDSYMFEASKGEHKWFYPKRPWIDYNYGYEFFNEKEGIWKVSLNNYKNEITIVPKDIYVYCTRIGSHIRHTQFLTHLDNDKTNDTFDNLKLLHKNDLVKKREPHPETLSVVCDHCGKEFDQDYTNVIWRKRASKTGNLFCSMACSVASRAINNTLSEEEQLKIKELRRAGKTLKEVTELTGYGANTIVKYQDKGSNSRQYTVNTRREEMIRDFSEGMSLNKMAKKYKLCKGTIRSIVKK